jgi:hypothetical protein
MERCSGLLESRGMKIKEIIRCSFTPLGLAEFQRASRPTARVFSIVENTYCHLLQYFGKSIWKNPLKLKIHTHCDLAIPLLGI